MIENLKIQNFKSIRDIDISCKKINVFIGEPNTGKSNLLEALVLLNEYEALEHFIRYNNLTDLFYDFDLGNEVLVKTGTFESTLVSSGDLITLESHLNESTPFKSDYFFDGSLKDSSSNPGKIKLLPKIKFYRYLDEVKFKESNSSSLEVPYGSNLDSVLQTNKALRSEIYSLVGSLGFKLVIKPIEHKIEFYKENEDITLSFSYETISDTIKRIIFYLAAISANEGNILLLEEPEAKTFPFYTQDLARQIVLDETNQYFIVTHNPYFLQTIIEKTPIKDLQINVCYSDSFETKVHQVRDEGVISEMIDMTSSIFFNFDLLLAR